MADLHRADDGVRIRLAVEETELLRSLMEQMLALLGDDGSSGSSETADPADPLASIGISENTTKPDDPVLARLFPDGYGDPGADLGKDDSEAAGDFRRYTELGLRDGKRAAAGTVLKTLPGTDAAAPTPAAPTSVVLNDEQAQVWLRALNDVRLALGTRLEITEEWYDEAAHLDPDDPRTAMFAVYDWLTMLQESLVQTLM